MQESKYVFVFSDLINKKIKGHVQALERCFLWLKMDRGSWVYLYTLSQSYGGIKRKIDDQNNDMIL
jgi:hypothetical protein